MHAPALSKRSKDFKDGEIEGDRRATSDLRQLFVSIGLVGPIDKRQGVAVFDHHPFGNAGGTGSKDKVSQLGGAGVSLQYGCLGAHAFVDENGRNGVGQPAR